MGRHGIVLMMMMMMILIHFIFAELDFVITFKTKSDKRIELELQKSSTLHSCDLEHRMEDIEYLTIGGDFDEVKSLSFILAS